MDRRQLWEIEEVVGDEEGRIHIKMLTDKWWLEDRALLGGVVGSRCSLYVNSGGYQRWKVIPGGRRGGVFLQSHLDRYLTDEEETTDGGSSLTSVATSKDKGDAQEWHIQYSAQEEHAGLAVAVFQECLLSEVKEEAEGALDAIVKAAETVDQMNADFNTLRKFQASVVDGENSRWAREGIRLFTTNSNTTIPGGRPGKLALMTGKLVVCAAVPESDLGPRGRSADGWVLVQELDLTDSEDSAQLRIMPKDESRPSDLVVDIGMVGVEEEEEEGTEKDKNAVKGEKYRYILPDEETRDKLVSAIVSVQSGIDPAQDLAEFN